MQKISMNNFAVLALAVLVAALAMFALAGTASAAGGFDQYGYNDTARIFNGLADGLDRNLDGTYYGNTTYATCLECGETVPDAEAPGEDDPPVLCRCCKLIDAGKCVECENAKSSQDRFQDRCVSCRLLEDR